MAKARKIPFLDPNQSVSISVIKILQTRFEEMISFEAGTIDGSDIEALHDMRVASRRLQAVLKIFRKLFPKKAFKKEYNELRQLIRALGEVRDYDVFIDRLQKEAELIYSQDRRALDLLLIRKRTERDFKRKNLIKLINDMNKRGYKENFYRFISSFELKS